MSGSCEPSCKQATRAAIPSSLLVRPFLYSPHGLTALGPFDPPPYSLYWFLRPTHPISLHIFESVRYEDRGGSWGLALPFAHRSFALEQGLLCSPGSPLFTQPHCLHTIGNYLVYTPLCIIYCPDVDLANEMESHEWIV